MKSTMKHIKLDWSKLLGFNQIKSAQGELANKSSRVLIGAKIGGKIGLKPV